MNQTLAGKTVLVTGATGFIGSRLVERLVLLEGTRVRALARTPARAARIARLPVELIFGDILDPETVAGAAAGCQVVMHCAYGNSGAAAFQRQVTIQGTYNVLQAAEKHDVERFVHVSTVHVHGLPHNGRIDERAPLRPEEGDGYATSKAESEALVWQAARERRLKVAILRPAFVYGPYSRWWTIIPIQRLQAGEFYLIDEGQGVCNAVYVDDVVQALVLAATHPRAVGEAFMVTNEAVTWAEFYGHYMRMVGVDGVASWDERSWRAAQRQRRLLGTPRGQVIARLGSPRVRELAQEFRPLGAGLRLARAIVPRRFYDRAASLARDLYRAKWWPEPLPQASDIKVFTTRCVYSAQKAQELLGYRPSVSLERGMEYTKDWLRYAGLI